MNLDFLRRFVGIEPKEPTEEEILGKKLHNDIINNPEEWEEVNIENYVFALKHKTKDITCKLWISASEYDFYDDFVTIDGKTIENPGRLDLYKIRKIYRKMERKKAVENLSKELEN